MLSTSTCDSDAQNVCMKRLARDRRWFCRKWISSVEFQGSLSAIKGMIYSCGRLDFGWKEIRHLPKTQKSRRQLLDSQVTYSSTTVVHTYFSKYHAAWTQPREIEFCQSPLTETRYGKSAFTPASLPVLQSPQQGESAVHERPIIRSREQKHEQSVLQKK